MFTYNQTKQIKDTATAKGLEFWEESHTHWIINHSKHVDSIMEPDHIIATDYQLEYDNDLPDPDLDYEFSQLTLDNLIPWLRKTFVKDGKKIWNPELISFENDRDEDGHDHLHYYLNLCVLYNSHYCEVGRIYYTTLAGELIQQAITLYFTDTQALTDMICEALEDNF